MSEHRKRRSSDSRESDRKIIAFEPLVSSVRQQFNSHVNNNGRPVRIQSVVVKPQEYFTNRRQMDYIKSLQKLDARYVNFNDLRRRLSGIDIRCYRIWHFSTALDLSTELESSLNHFVDTKNELIFLRKLQRLPYIPFSYKEINIANTKGLHNRMNFLEHETVHLSNRTNELFHQLQSVVSSSTVDDIRYMHSVLYKNSWTDQARFWFSQLKQIKSENTSRRAHLSHNAKDKIDVTNRGNIKPWVFSFLDPFQTKSVERSDDVKSLLQRSLKKLRKSRERIKKFFAEELQANRRQYVEGESDLSDSCVIIEPNASLVDMPQTLSFGSQNVHKIDVTNRENIKSEVVDMLEELSFKTKSVERSDDVKSLLQRSLRETRRRRKLLAAERLQTNRRQYVESESESDLSESCVIIEPNVSLVTVSDDDEADDSPDSSNNANPPEGCIKN